MRRPRIEAKAPAWPVPLLALAAAALMAWAVNAAEDPAAEEPAAAVAEPSDDLPKARSSAQPDTRSASKESTSEGKRGGKREEGTGADGPLDVETILNNPLDDEAYRDRRTCLHTRAVDRVEILNDSLVLFHVRRKKAWLNKLSSRCLGLDRDMIVNLRVFGGTVCRLDTFRGLSRMGNVYPAAHCRLGDFEAMEGAQIEALRAALKEQRQAAKLERKTRRAERRERKRAERQ